MSRSRLMVGVVMILALAVGFGCSASSAGSEDLEQQVKALTQRVDALEKQLAAVKSANVAPSAQDEQQAAAALNQIQQLVAAGNTVEAKKQLGEFQKKYANTKAGRSSMRMAQELAVVGKESPKDWGIEKWYQGQDKIDLSGKGTTLVVFWETWCPHCQREVPKLEALYESYNSKGLQLVGLTKVTRSSTDETVNQFIADKKLSYPVAKENGSASTYFGVSGIPAAAVVKDGEIVWRGHPATLNEDMLKGWL